VGCPYGKPVESCPLILCGYFSAVTVAILLLSFVPTRGCLGAASCVVTAMAVVRRILSASERSLSDECYRFDAVTLGVNICNRPPQTPDSRLQEFLDARREHGFLPTSIRGVLKPLCWSHHLVLLFHMRPANQATVTGVALFHKRAGCPFSNTSVLLHTGPAKSKLDAWHLHPC
jgi:hypothetical protein